MRAAEIISPCLIALFPAAMMSFSVGRGTGNGALGSAVSGVLGVLLAWYAGLASDAAFSPFIGLISVAVAESHSVLQSKKDAQFGNSVPRSNVLVALLIGLGTAIACQQIGARIAPQQVVGLFRYGTVRWILMVLGGLVLVSLLHLVGVMSPKAQRFSDEARALMQSMVRDYFPTSPRPYERAERIADEVVQRIRSDPRSQKAESLYLEAIEADQAILYGINKSRQELNRATAYNELAKLFRLRELLEQSVAHSKRAIECLEPWAEKRNNDEEVLFLLSVAYFRFAEANHVAGNLGVAREYYERGLKIDEQVGDAEGQKLYRRMLLKLA